MPESFDVRTTRVSPSVLEADPVSGVVKASLYESDELNDNRVNAGEDCDEDCPKKAETLDWATPTARTVAKIFILVVASRLLVGFRFEKCFWVVDVFSLMALSALRVCERRGCGGSEGRETKVTIENVISTI